MSLTSIFYVTQEFCSSISALDDEPECGDGVASNETSENDFDAEIPLAQCQQFFRMLKNRGLIKNENLGGPAGDGTTATSARTQIGQLQLDCAQTARETVA